MQKHEQDEDMWQEASLLLFARERQQSLDIDNPKENVYENLWFLKIHTPIILKPFRYSWRGWAWGTQPARTTFFFPSWAFLKEDKQCVNSIFFLIIIFNFNTVILCMWQQKAITMKISPHQKQLVHVWAPETNKPAHQKKPIWSYSTPGSVWVCTETMTIASLGQKQNLESPNQVHLTLSAKMVEEEVAKKDGTE